MHATLNAFLDSKMTVTLEQTGEQFALRLKSDKEGTLLVWLSKEQLNALGFAVEVAQQEAEQAAYNASCGRCGRVSAEDNAATNACPSCSDLAEQQAEEYAAEMLDGWVDACRARGVFV